MHWMAALDPRSSGRDTTSEIRAVMCISLFVAARQKNNPVLNRAPGVGKQRREIVEKPCHSASVRGEHFPEVPCPRQEDDLSGLYIGLASLRPPGFGLGELIRRG